MSVVPVCFDQSVDLCEHVKFHPLSQYGPSCHVTSLCEPFLVCAACGGALVVLPGSGRRAWEAAWRSSRQEEATPLRTPWAFSHGAAKLPKEQNYFIDPAPGNNSFAFPGNLNTIYCCRLNAGCGAGGRSEWQDNMHVICYTMLKAPQTFSTSWCGLLLGGPSPSPDKLSLAPRGQSITPNSCRWVAIFCLL